MVTSSYRTEDDNDHLSIEYTNLYLIDGVFTFLHVGTEMVLPSVNVFRDKGTFVPNVIGFNTYEELNDYVNSLGELETIPLGVRGELVWSFNIGHALWDGFYPAYLSLVKFGHTSAPFVLVSNIFPTQADMIYDIITQFSGNTLIEMPTNRRIKFAKFVAGTGRAGIGMMNQEYTIYGSKYNGMELFKERMLETYGIENKPVNITNPSIVIINNKRYSSQERQNINNVIDFLKPFTNIRFLDWSHCNSFEAQLRELENVDIHITGPGTGMMYMPFLKKGAVNINLGCIIERGNNIPGWMEQAVCAGCQDVSTLYYDRCRYPEIQETPLVEIMNEALDILTLGTVLDDKHHLDAKIFIEYCRQSNNPDEVCQYLSDAAMFIELFVNEYPDAVSPGFIDVELLRKIKTEMQWKKE